MPNVRAVLLAQAEALPAGPVAVLLSGGIDSASLLFALRAVGREVVAYSFMLDGRVSTDFADARRHAAQFRIPFTPIFLPRDLAQLQADCVVLRDHGARSKTDFECGWPMLHAYAAVRERIVASGMGADGHFCISKKGMIHYRERIDDFRRALYASPTYAQAHLHAALAARHDCTTWMPYLTDAMRAEFLGTTWDEVNKPRQKQPILDAFPGDFARIRVALHRNLQLGDSGIADHCTGLLRTSWNLGPWKSVTGIYHALAIRRLP